MKIFGILYLEQVIEALGVEYEVKNNLVKPSIFFVKWNEANSEIFTVYVMEGNVTNISQKWYSYGLFEKSEGPSNEFDLGFTQHGWIRELVTDLALYLLIVLADGLLYWASIIVSLHILKNIWWHKQLHEWKDQKLAQIFEVSNVMESFVWWQNILNSKDFHDGLQFILNQRYWIKLQGRVLTNACKLEYWLIRHVILLS